MKKILALTLALMLALSLTAALAADEGNTTVPLNVTVTPSTVNNVAPQEVWNVDIDAASLTWALVERTELTGDPTRWSRDTNKYAEPNVANTVTVVLGENEQAHKTIAITNNSNFDVNCSGELAKDQAFEEALSLDGASGELLINKFDETYQKIMVVRLDVTRLHPPVMAGRAGTVTISLSKSGAVYPYVPADYE